MGFTVDGFNRAKNEMARAVNKALTDADALREAVGSCEGVAAVQVIVEKEPGNATESLAGTSHADATTADGRVHDVLPTEIDAVAAASKDSVSGRG